MIITCMMATYCAALYSAVPCQCAHRSHNPSLSLVCPEKRLLPNNRVYYVNHKSKTTQWEDPRQSMADLIPLPAGWEMRFSENGQKYFIDHNTRQTTFQGLGRSMLCSAVLLCSFTRSQEVSRQWSSWSLWSLHSV